MKKVYIRRGCLWFNGQLFKSGDTVEVDNETAAKLEEDKINEFIVDSPSVAAVPETPSKPNKANKQNNSGEIPTDLPLPDDLTGKPK